MPIDRPTQDKILQYLRQNGRTDERIIQLEFKLSRERTRQLRIAMSKDRRHWTGKMTHPRTIRVTAEGNFHFWEVV